MDSVVDVRAASILHVAAGDRFIALATSSNTLLLLAAAEDGTDGTDDRPPLVRQMRWFSGPDKGVAAMHLHDEAGLLVASHDGSAFVLPMHRLMRRPPSPIGTPSGELLVLPGGLEIQCDASSGACEADEGQELIAIHAAAMYSRTAGGISSCAFWHGFPGGGGGAVLGSLDGSLHLLGVRGREQLRSVPVGAAISQLWLVADAAAGTDDTALGEGVGWVLVRLLQGTYLRMELREPYELLPVPLASAHPRAELWVQRSSTHGELLLLHTARDGRLQVARPPPRARTRAHARARARTRIPPTMWLWLQVHSREAITHGVRHPLFVYMLPVAALPASIVLGAHCAFCVQPTPDGTVAASGGGERAGAAAGGGDGQGGASGQGGGEGQGGGGGRLEMLVVSRALSEEGRHAAARHVIPEGLLQAIPLALPPGARLTGATSCSFGGGGSGDGGGGGGASERFVFWSVGGLHHLCAWMSPAVVRKRLRFAPALALPLPLAVTLALTLTLALARCASVCCVPMTASLVTKPERTRRQRC